jgi:hypothetical protein
VPTKVLGVIASLGAIGSAALVLSAGRDHAVQVRGVPRRLPADARDEVALMPRVLVVLVVAAVALVLAYVWRAGRPGTKRVRGLASRLNERSAPVDQNREHVGERPPPR